MVMAKETKLRERPETLGGVELDMGEVKGPMSGQGGTPAALDFTGPWCCAHHRLC